MATTVSEARSHSSTEHANRDHLLAAAASLREEVAKWAEVVKVSGAKAE